MFITRCITPEEAYRDVEWKAIILISCMLGLGAAMEHTGTADFLAQWIVDLFGKADPRFSLAGFFGLTMFLTQPMSNQAAAAVVVPIALQTAVQLGVNPRTFAMMIAIGARLLISHTVGAILHYGLRPRQIPILGLSKGRLPAHARHLYTGDDIGAAAVAVIVTKKGLPLTI